jgi:hypothetical protein
LFPAEIVGTLVSRVYTATAAPAWLIQVSDERGYLIVDEHVTVADVWRVVAQENPGWKFTSDIGGWPIARYLFRKLPSHFMVRHRMGYEPDLFHIKIHISIDINIPLSLSVFMFLN